jgi:hypothetical protein
MSKQGMLYVSYNIMYMLYTMFRYMQSTLQIHTKRNWRVSIDDFKKLILE